MKTSLLFALLFLALVPVPKDGELWHRAFDAAHLPAFAVACWLIWEKLPPLARMSRETAALLITVGAAAAVELIQPIFHRSASWIDLWGGIAGAIIAALAIRLVQSGTGLFGLTGCALLSAATALFFSAPFFQEAEAVRWQRDAFPLLADFEQPVQLRFWQPMGAARLARSQGALTVVTAGHEFSGAEYRAGDRDWSRKRALEFEVFSAVEFRLAIRIDDDGDCTEFESRFNTVVAIARGANRIVIPLSDLAAKGREFNRARIRRMLLFVEPREEPVEFTIDNAHLR